MVLKLHGSAMSTSRVLTVLHELELPYEYVVIDIAKGDQKDETYKKMQPWGRVPVLEDDGFFIHESRAICKYLVRKNPSSKVKLMPNEGDYKAYGAFEQACSIEQSYFAVACEAWGTEVVIRPKMGLGPVDKARVAEAAAKFEDTLVIYNERLSGQKFVAGDHLTLADLFHLPNGAAMKAFGFKDVIEKYPYVDKWFAALQERESWKKAASTAGTVA